MSEAPAFAAPRAFQEFRIVRSLGRGAMGEVFLAEDELLGRQVAIKFIRDDRPALRSRFLQEARALARLSHPNVVTVHRVGEVLGRPFLVSEWVQGESLDRVPLPLPPGAALQVALQLARALAAVHRVGVLHRDLKPANVLVSAAGELKLVDFGVSAEGAREEPGVPARTLSLAETQPLPGRATSADAAPAARLEVGTPLYAAPELLAGGESSRQSDLYGWGAVLYEVCSGAPPYPAGSLDELSTQAREGRFRPLTSVAGPLAALVHRCLAPSPADRPARAEALLEQLEPLLLAGAGATVHDEPYRGLSVFGPEHAALFFGREREVQAVLERLRGTALVLVAGDSGVGKSSLCRAGVLPQLEAFALGRDRRFQVIEAGLGSRPVETLAAALSPLVGRDEQAVAAALRAEPEQLASRLRAVPEGQGRALFLDGLEELATLAAPEDAAALGRFLGALCVRTPGFRCLATVRSEFLTRLSALPSLGPEVGAALFLLRPLTDEGLRQAIEGPARAAGFRFAPESLVDELVAAARLGPGALPLVQFALGELWRKRGLATRTISGEALASLGGVSGALARHADEVVAALPGGERRAAEQIVRRLVTAQGTRARRSREELPAGDEASRALAALTAARLLLSRDPAEGKGATWELAHEALIQGWDQLRAWLGRDAEKRALAQRVERAAEEWERAGPEALWSRRALREAAGFEDLPLGERERRFLAASRRNLGRQRALRLGAAVLVPALLAATVFAVRHRARAASRAEAEGRLEAAAASLQRARALGAEEEPLRARAFAAFDRGDAAEGERDWRQVRALRSLLEEALTSARASAEGALLAAPSAPARELLAQLLLFRLEREQGDPLSPRREGLLAQLAPLDPKGLRAAPFLRPARVRLARAPGGAQAALRRLGPGPAASVPLTAGAERETPPGSYVLELSTGARLPLLLRFGQRVELSLPDGSPAPEGFILVPAGRFLTGYDGDEDLRLGFFSASPLHERDGPAFSISRYEVTFGQWLEYLRALPPELRARRLPRAETLRNGLSVTQRADGRFLLEMKPTTTTYRALEGERLQYRGRQRNASAEWTRFPVTGVSFGDAQAYAAWLSSTGRVPGARLCREDEWERAARGADGRSFPGGDTLAGDDANIDETYGREPLAFGPDPVGSHPRSDSPVGAADLAGNAYELAVGQDGKPVIRGGSWYQGALTARSVNREPYEPTARDLLIGLRLCAGAP